MKIDGFKMDGIANIEHANLRTGELCALIAPNGYGKSNVLSAIEFGIRFLTADDAERRQMLSGPAYHHRPAVERQQTHDILVHPLHCCKETQHTDDYARGT